MAVSFSYLFVMTSRMRYSLLVKKWMSDMKFRIQITLMLLIDAVVVNDLCIHRRVSAGENFCTSTFVLSFKEVL